MKSWLVVAMALVLFCVCGCNCQGITGERLKEINSEWYRIYNVDRKPTEAEAVEYAALTAEGKAAWEAAGKPVPGPLHARMLAAATEYKESIDEEAEANR